MDAGKLAVDPGAVNEGRVVIVRIVFGAVLQPR